MRHRVPFPFLHLAGMAPAGGLRVAARWLTLGLLFVVPWEAAVQVAGVGRFSKVLGFVAFATWTLSVLARRQVRGPGAVQWAALAFVVWSGTTLLWSVDTHATASGFLTYTQLFLLVLLLWDLSADRGFRLAALQAFVLGAFVASGSIIVNFLTSPPPEHAAHHRVNALGFETDGIALLVALAMPAAWFLGSRAAAKGRDGAAGAVLNYLYLPPAALAIALTGTRGATLAAIPALLYLAWEMRAGAWAPRVAGVAVAALSALALITLAPSGPLDRIWTATTAADLEAGALEGRLGIWSESARLFEQRPVGGVGLDAHRAAVAPAIARETVFKKTGKEAHNTYMSILAETGIVGFGLFLLLVVAVLARLRRGRDRMFWSAQLAVLAVGAMSLSLEDSKSLWILLSLASAAAAGTAAAPLRARPRRALPVRLQGAPVA